MGKTQPTGEGSAGPPGAIGGGYGAAKASGQPLSQGGHTGLEPRELIEILMREYEMLAQEIGRRINSRLAIAGYIGGAVVFVLTQLRGVAWPDLVWPLSALATSKQVVWPVAILVVTFFLLLAWWLRLGALIKKCSVRIAEIEGAVNDLAGHELLVWETRQQATGLFHKFYRGSGE